MEDELRILVYYAFGWHQYYPSGGMNDYQGLFYTEKEARDYVCGREFWEVVALFTDRTLRVVDSGYNI